MEKDNSKELAIKNKCEKDYPEFTNAQSGTDVESLKKNLLIYAEHREETELARKKDEELKKAKENVSFLDAPYKDAIKALKLKTAYLHILIKEKQGNE